MPSLLATRKRRSKTAEASQQEDDLLTAARKRTPGHEANRVAALNAAWARRRESVAAGIERAGLQLFVAQGIEAVTSEAVALAAGISRRTFYRYFDAPIDIIRTVICRSMDRWAAAVRARPLSEPLLDAFVSGNAFALAPGEDAELLGLALSVMQSAPEAWARIAPPMQAHTAQVYEGLIAERLAATGGDVAQAGAIAAGLTAIFVHIARESAGTGRPPRPGAFEEAIRAFLALMAA